MIENLMKLGNDEASKELEDKSETESWQAAQGKTPVHHDLGDAADNYG